MKILAPHKEQSGFVYVRVKRRKRAHMGHAMPEGAPIPVGAPLGLFTSPGITAFYHDNVPDARTISSRRVEEAVETADYLKRCADEGLGAAMGMSGKWWVGRRTAVACGSFYSVTLDPAESAPTLREAYYRYKNQEAKP